MRFTYGGLAFVLAVCLATVALAQGPAAAQQDILALAKDVAAGKDIAAKAALLPKKYEDLEDLMAIYKPRPKGGLGFEVKIRSLASGQALTPAQLQQEAKDLIQMAHVNTALAEITRHYFRKPRNGKIQKDWDEYLSVMKKTSTDMIAAVKARDPRKLKETAANLDNACNKCHSDFRD
jgi:hypothetical protein